MDPAWVIVCGDSVEGAVGNSPFVKSLWTVLISQDSAQILIYSTLQSLDFQSPFLSAEQNISTAQPEFDLLLLVWLPDISPS